MHNKKTSNILHCSLTKADVAENLIFNYGGRSKIEKQTNTTPSQGLVDCVHRPHFADMYDLALYDDVIYSKIWKAGLSPHYLRNQNVLIN